MKKLIFTFIICAIAMCHFAHGSTPNHSTWDALLKKHVTPTGEVNYKGFIKDSLKLNSYLDELESHPPKDNWSKAGKIAYWLNVYNAFTVKLIIKHYPLKSIKDIGSSIQIPFVNTPWDVKFIEIGGEKMDLNKVEHGILRKDFEEARIHFAVNCASYSCPKLRNEAYTADKLDEQLNDQARDFINDKRKNKIISANKAHLSKIFQWYKGDFTNEMGLIPYINQFTDTKLSTDAQIDHMEYRWDLNEQ